MSLQHWLLIFGEASEELRLTVEEFVEWITNGQPPWAACRAFMETLRTCAQYLTAARREETDYHRANTYHSLVLRGKLQTAVRWIT